MSGRQPAPFPRGVRIRGFQIGGHTVLSRRTTCSRASRSCVVMVRCWSLLFRFTDLGLRMRAAAFEPEVARLLGVRVARMLTLGWALAAVVGALAGLLVAPAAFVCTQQLHGPRLRLRLHRRGARRARQPGRRGGRRPGRSALALSYVVRLPRRAAGARSAALVILIAVLMVRPEGLFAPARRQGGALMAAPHSTPRTCRGTPHARAPPAGRCGGRAVRCRARPRSTRSATPSSPTMAVLPRRGGRADRPHRAQRPDSLGHGALMAVGAYTTAQLLARRRAGSRSPRARCSPPGGHGRRSASWSARPPPGCAGPTWPARRSASRWPAGLALTLRRRSSAASRADGGPDAAAVARRGVPAASAGRRRSPALGALRRPSSCWRTSCAAGSGALAGGARRRGRRRSWPASTSAGRGCSRSWSAPRARPARRAVRRRHALAAPGAFTLTLTLTLLTAVVIGGLGSLTGALLGAPC